MKQNKNEKKTFQNPFAQTYFHGTKADLNNGAFMEFGFSQQELLRATRIWQIKAMKEGLAKLKAQSIGSLND